ncbi:multiubiquitin domain-containing protein [Sulfurimonas sp. HSL-3221]|uniref:multiubiquitin domain-containing protein n=1 Tax=Sulfurimonadaceae TaxID=2771471 RepID=UPI001E2B29B9|nr:multiubiquitin domain-containing protein [Sulfurimonas sp. HSL-3221]UFS62746.1 multiubiquitin domain-containing protein [Sulfurimonas sp. HSL-3221]
MPGENNNGSNAPGQNKEYSIIINGRPVTVKDHKLTYEQVLELAKIPAGGQTTLYIITYERGEHGNAEGTLAPGGFVVIKDGMVFNVDTTNKS